jgi:hypothetical protein
MGKNGLYKKLVDAQRISIDSVSVDQVEHELLGHIEEEQFDPLLNGIDNERDGPIPNSEGARRFSLVKGVATILAAQKRHWFLFALAVIGAFGAGGRPSRF